MTNLILLTLSFVTFNTYFLKCITRMFDTSFLIQIFFNYKLIILKSFHHAIYCFSQIKSRRLYDATTIRGIHETFWDLKPLWLRLQLHFWACLGSWKLRGFRFGVRFLLAVCYPVLKKYFSQPASKWFRLLIFLG